MPKITAPTLITCGEFDECRPQRMREAASLMPNARVAVIPDCAHLPYIKNPRAYVDAIDGFLSAPAVTPAPSLKKPLDRTR